MAKSLNRVTILGNVGKSPESKFLDSGTEVVEFSVATSEKWKDKAGEWQERTEWHNCKAFAGTAGVVSKYVNKGDRIYLEGKLTTRSWEDKDTGKKVYRTEIVVSDVNLIGGKGQQSSSPDSSGEHGDAFDETEPF